MRSLDVRKKPHDGWQGWIGLAFLVVLVFGTAGWYLYENWLAADAILHVDNGLPDSVLVRIDGGSPRPVPAGSHVQIWLWSGKRLIEVQQGEQVIFSETHEVPAGKSPEKPGQVLLNPGAARCYRTHQVHYGMQLMPNLNLGGMHHLFKPSLRDELQKLRKQVTLVPRSAWVDLKGIDHILEKAPEKIEGLIAGQRTVLLHVDPADHAILSSADRNNAPTVDDLETVRAAIERILRDQP